MGALALTIDLDGLEEYAALHGESTTTSGASVMYGEPLSRFVELCEDIGATGTLFVVGRDARRHARQLREVAGRGFEIASHSFAHDYHLSRRSAPYIRADVTRARDVIAEAVGETPHGFRAPGYHLSGALLDALEDAGFVYDSSVFPSPTYYLAKAAVLTAYRVLGKRSASLLGSPKLVFAPSRPYHPAQDDPYSAGARRLLEVPISVAKPLNLPITGASLALAPATLRRLLTHALEREPTVVLNFHGMDLCDVEHVPAELAKRQPELRLPWAIRRERLREVVRTLAHGRDAMPLLKLVTRTTRAA